MSSSTHPLTVGEETELSLIQNVNCWGSLVVDEEQPSRGKGAPIPKLLQRNDKTNRVS